MNRIIKFRGQRTDGKGWVYGDLLTNYIHHKSGATITYGGGCVLNEVKPETVGQFTGELDNNNVEVYEGDIITFDHDERCKIVFRNGCFTGQDIQPLREAFTGDVPKGIVTGNIHEQKQEA